MFASNNNPVFLVVLNKPDSIVMLDELNVFKKGLVAINILI
jgi:hypothetical protein